VTVQQEYGPERGALSPDSVVGIYRLVREIGRGGMSTVWLAMRTDQLVTRPVALKLPHLHLQRAQFADRFARERDILANLTHPNIAHLYDAGISPQGQPFLAMEFVGGDTLTQYCQSHGLGIEERLGLFLQVLAAVAYAHSQSIIHRDLKPSNILVREGGHVVLLDFGIAKLLIDGAAAETELTRQAGATLTPDYASPEQIRGEPLGPATDVYSLGVILYELLSGRRPYAQARTTRRDLEDAILSADPRRPSEAVTSTGQNEGPPVAPEALRIALQGDLDTIVLKALQKQPENRYPTVDAFADDLRRHLRHEAIRAHPDALGRRLRTFTSRHRSALRGAAVSGAAALALVAVIANLPHALTDRFRSSKQGVVQEPAKAEASASPVQSDETVLLADFGNSTGEDVFEDTLQTALSISLRQSPFLNLIPDSKVSSTLQQMTLPTNTKLTPEVARDLCLRAGGTAYVAGVINRLGSEYVLRLRAVSCSSGDTLSQVQSTAATKEQVLVVLGEAASKLRGGLGESLATVHKFDVPLEQATTNSLDALRAYTLGVDAASRGDYDHAILFLRRSIEVDSNFAQAYIKLGIFYHNLNEHSLASDFMQKAFDLRDRATEYEGLYITGTYYELAIGDLDQASRTYALWIQLYPRAGIAHTSLGDTSMILGRYDKAVAEVLEGIHLGDDRDPAYGVLAQSYLALNEFTEANAVLQEQLRHGIDEFDRHLFLYLLAFCQADQEAMQQQADWAVGKPYVEDWMLSLQSDTEASFGRLENARRLSRQAVDSALRNNRKESAALWQANAAIREALFGNTVAARTASTVAVKIVPGSREVQMMAAIGYALVGDTARAQSLAASLANEFPQDTVVQAVGLPTIRAQVEAARRNPTRSIELLRVAAPYDLGVLDLSDSNSCMYAEYVRAQAYLSTRQGAAAAAEFQKILDHRGLVQNCATGVLARLGLARANVLNGEFPKARANYGDFLTRWKGADAGIPILVGAQSEFAKLRRPPR
jgi:eukaryotic-like serine/threonine-protein kinase